ncbi:MAG: glycosyltransferase [Ruminiclostridium sp.]|nr:glycosyltransferase [Ruminiclostridium sp.]
MLLSIGMIVKNEEKYLEQCLTALKPILDNVDSELIIADTGSTDRTVEIAQKFTDNVFYFEWIKDFAAARNSTLEKAHGEWYMFVDADEIFRSCDGIINFFNSGEYKKYNSASYTIRNYLKGGEKENFADFSGPRITKILPHTRFVGEIHESLNTYGAPFKKLDVMCDHYGYSYADNSEFEEKFKRNSELLIKKYESGQHDEMLYAQLYECFIGHDPEKADKFMEEGIEVCKQNNSIVLTVLYSDKMNSLVNAAKYEEALKISDDYFGMDKAIRSKELTTDAEIYGLKAMTLYRINQYDDAIEAYIKYFELYKLIFSGKLNTYDMFLQTYTIATERNFIPILNEFTRCCILAGRYNTASMYLQKLPIYKYIVKDDHVTALVHQEIDIMEHFDYEGALKYYRQLDETGKRVFIELLRDRMYYSDKRDSIIGAISEIGKDSQRITDKISFYNDYFSENTITEKELTDFAEKYGIDDDADLFMIAVSNDQDISKLFVPEDFNMKLCIYICYMNIYGFAKKFEEYSCDNVKDVDKIPSVLKFYEYCMKIVPIYRCPKPGVFVKLSVDKLFENYAALGKRYAEKSGIAANELLPEIKAALIANEIVAMRNEKRYKECFAAMKKAVACYDGIAAVINEYQKNVISEFEESVNSDPSKEMERLALKVKRNIRRLISGGDFSSAKQMLDQYRQISPDDPDIDVLYSRIGINV